MPYDGHALGPWLAKLQPGLAKSVGLAVMTNESRDLGHYNRSIGAFPSRPGSPSGPPPPGCGGRTC